MDQKQLNKLIDIDRQHIWHPYSSVTTPMPNYLVESAHGVILTLADGRKLIDGMASWWCMIHGYNHPVMNQAMKDQIDQVSHIMFGGLTHKPAIQLTQKLLEITPEPLQQVFFSDSGSVAVEVAIKMAIQYWHTQKQPEKNRLLTIRHGYHGDTFGAMSVCDPTTGMHSIFNSILAKQIFVESPNCKFHEQPQNSDIDPIRSALKAQHHQIAAIILEPIVQGAGGMYFYSPAWLAEIRKLCDEFQVLLILDEIATGFGRTGKLFACQHANITPDIMCIGKALTGGYVSMAATLTTNVVSQGICNSDPGVLMHGPTFMANPLACATAIASIDLLLESNWQQTVKHIETQLLQYLAPAQDFAHITEVRVLGAIGVIEAKTPVRMQKITQAFVDKGIWLRPFGKLVYIMPPFIIDQPSLKYLTKTIIEIIKDPQFFE